MTPRVCSCVMTLNVMFILCFIVNCLFLPAMPCRSSEGFLADVTCRPGGSPRPHGMPVPETSGICLASKSVRSPVANPVQLRQEEDLKATPEPSPDDGCAGL